MSKKTTELEDKVMATVAAYVKAGGDYQRIIALIQFAYLKPKSSKTKAATEDDATEDTTTDTTNDKPPSIVPAVNPPVPKTPYPVDSVFSVRIGGRAIGGVRCGFVGTLLERSHADRQLWALVNDYIRKNDLDADKTIAETVPARVLNKFLRESSIKVVAA